jgi:hypothetical protein
MERYQRLPYFGTLRETGREEDREIAGEEERTHRQPMFLEGMMDFIIILFLHEIQLCVYI